MTTQQSLVVEQVSMLPKWSIVCVVHNQAQDLMRWMRKAMESRSSDWEIVVADAGSSDGTSELLGAICNMEPRIRMLPRSDDHWLTVLRQATERTLGEFVIVQFPSADLPDLDQLSGHRFDRLADVVDIRQIGGGVWPACRRGQWIHSAIDAAAYQPPEQIAGMLAEEGARLVVCQAPKSTSETC